MKNKENTLKHSSIKSILSEVVNFINI
jgi:hypothetical protein